MEACPKNQDTTTGSPQKMFTCTVRLEIRGCDCYCEGTGFGGDRNDVEKGYLYQSLILNLVYKHLVSILCKLLDVEIGCQLQVFH